MSYVNFVNRFFFVLHLLYSQDLESIVSLFHVFYSQIGNLGEKNASSYWPSWSSVTCGLVIAEFILWRIWSLFIVAPPLWRNKNPPEHSSRAFKMPHRICFLNLHRLAIREVEDGAAMLHLTAAAVTCVSMLMNPPSTKWVPGDAVACEAHILYQLHARPLQCSARLIKRCKHVCDTSSHLQTICSNHDAWRE